jgi:Sel1 repeat-containing protein
MWDAILIGIVILVAICALCGLVFAIITPLRYLGIMKGDWEQRWIGLMEKAWGGDGNASFKLSQLSMSPHYSVFRPPLHYAKANDARMAEWLKKAADQGYAEAQRVLGHLYMLGTSPTIGQDGRSAVLWYRKAADQGDVAAQYSLGTCYLLGTMGGDEDEAEGIKWYLMAAERHFERTREALPHPLP